LSVRGATARRSEVLPLVGREALSVVGPRRYRLSVRGAIASRSQALSLVGVMAGIANVRAVGRGRICRIVAASGQTFREISGTVPARNARMAIARHYSQLIVWQLADALRTVIFRFTRRPPFLNDFKHRSQTEDAIDSACRNIAEGFGCTSDTEFARYLEISRRSLNEVCDALNSARLKGYIGPVDSAEVYRLTRRLYPALNNFIAHLNRNPHGRRRRRPRSQAS